jgi:uncharacterized caspase-like protein
MDNVVNLIEIENEKAQTTPKPLVVFRLNLIHEPNDEQIRASKENNYIKGHEASDLKRKRAALVIGNANYETMSLWFAKDLSKSIHNDAAAMAHTLTEMGYAVSLKYDLKQVEMLKAVQELNDKVSDENGVALFYYSGIGRVIDNQSFLIPVDASAPNRPNFKSTAIELQTILTSLKKYSDDKDRTNILLLDAGPLSEIESQLNTIVGFASQPYRHLNPNRTDQENSIYTEALLRFLREPRLRIDDFFNKVSDYVTSRTKSNPMGPQKPWAIYGKRDFYLHP